MIVRLAEERDIDGLFALAQTASMGMTTVPNTREAMADRVARSCEAVTKTGPATADDVFFFVLESGDEVLGMAAIIPDLGGKRPFYSYRVSKVVATAPAIGVEASSDLLYLCNDFHGYTEIGTLLVSAKARGTGAGRLLSLSRFLFMSIVGDRISPNIIAEIRGRCEEPDYHPFWDAVASKFFKMSFHEADRRSAHDFQFIADLMPKFPVYAALLPEEAQAVLGQPHKTSAAAMNMLLREGFRFSQCIDIFDGGPSLETTLPSIRTIEESALATVELTDMPPVGDGGDSIVGVPHTERFRTTLLPRGDHEGHLQLSPAEAQALGVEQGEQIVVSPVRGRRSQS